MIEPTLSDLMLQISVRRNLDSTVNSFKNADIPVWEKLLLTNPAEFFRLAIYGYKMRQTKKGQREVSQEELEDFQRQFISKFYYVGWKEAGIPSEFLGRLMFDID